MNYDEILCSINEYYNKYLNETNLEVKRKLVEILNYLAKLLAKTPIEE